MASTQYGVGEFVWGPGFGARRDAQGRWTARAVLTGTRATWLAQKEAFRKGAKLTDLTENINAWWNFLRIDELDLDEKEGGMVQVRVSLTGWQADFAEDEEGGVVLQLQALEVERPITEHPMFVREIVEVPVTGACDAILLGMKGLAQADPFALRAIGDSVAVWNNVAMAFHPASPLTDEASIWWWDWIVTRGNHTFPGRTLEWTVRETLGRRITGMELERYGLVDGPPFNPPVFPGARFEWRWTGLTETTEAGASERERRWVLSPPGGFEDRIFDFDLNQFGED